MAEPTVEEVKASWVNGTLWADHGVPDWETKGYHVPADPKINGVLEEALKELDPHQQIE